MNLAGRGLLGVAVSYSGWVDREMAGYLLLEVTAALQYASDAELHSQYSDVSKQLSAEK